MISSSFMMLVISDMQLAFAIFAPKLAQDKMAFSGVLHRLYRT